MRPARRGDRVLEPLRALLTALTLMAGWLLPAYPAAASALPVPYAPAAVSRGGAAVPPAGTTGLLFGPTDISGEPGPQSETSVAVDPSNPQIIVAGANDLAGAGEAAWSTRDGGKTWTRAEMPVSDVAGESAESATDPGVAAGPHGRFYFSYALVSADGNSASIVVSASTDGGRVWGEPAVVTPGITQGLDNDKDLLAVDDWGDAHRGYLYDVWDQNEPSGVVPTQQVMLAYSPPGGTDWSKPIVLNLGYGSGVGIYAVPTVAPDGSVYVVWDDYGQSNEQSVLVGRRCAWAGPTFACGPAHVAARSFVNIDGPGPLRGGPVDCASEQPDTAPFTPLNEGWDCYAIPPQPARGIAANPSLCAGQNGQLNLVFDTASSPGAGNTEVEYTSSSDGGVSWTVPVEIDGDAAHAYDFFPWVACDPVTGALAVAFYSTRGDPTGQLVQEMLTWSLDGGQSWTPPQTVSGFPSNEATPVANNNDYGDYEGLALWDDVAYPVWTGDTGSAALAEQVFAAAVRVPIVPPAPLGLSVTPASASAQTLRWAPTDGAVAYNVYVLPPRGAASGTVAGRGTVGGVGALFGQGGVTAAVTGRAVAPRLLIGGLSSPSVTYHWSLAGESPVLAVQAVDAAGAGPLSAAFTLPVPSAPAAPQHTIAVSTGSSSVRVAWSPVAQAGSYTLFIDGHTWRSGLSAASVRVVGLRPATRYAFGVEADDAVGLGAYGLPVFAVTAPLAPRGLRAQVLSGSVRLAWQPSAGASSYLIFRGRTGPHGAFASIGRSAAPAYSDEGLPERGTFWYMVRAVDGPSAPSPSTPAVRVELHGQG